MKVVDVDQRKDPFTTIVLVELHQSDGDRSWQANATWKCEWNLQPNRSPILKSIDVQQYEESEVRSVTGKWFSDQTKKVIGNNACFTSQFQYGHHYWLQRIEKSHRFDTSMRSGLAIGDANNDGLDDV